MKRLVKVNIGGHHWSVRLMKPEDMGNNWGGTWCVHRAIDLNDTLAKEEMVCVIKHEVCHAVLFSQGRRVQNKFNVEEICDFVAWNGDEIERITKEIMKKLFEVDKNE